MTGPRVGELPRLPSGSVTWHSSAKNFQPLRRGPPVTDHTQQPSLTTLPPGLGKLSPTIAMALGNMTDHERDIFDHEYRKARRNTPPMVLLAVLLPIQWFFLDKTGLGIVFWFSAMFLVIGWIWSWFYTPTMVREYNEAVANTVIRNIRYAAGQ